MPRFAGAFSFLARDNRAQVQVIYGLLFIDKELNRLVRMIFSQILRSVGTCYAVPMVRGSPNPRHFGLPARLLKARKKSGLTRKALGQKVGRDSEVAANIEAGERLPTVRTIARLASALGVSASWLAYGLGEQSRDEAAANTEDLGARLHAVRIERQISKAELARRADLSPRAIGNIESGAQSGVEVVEALAQALGVSPGWLAFGEGPTVLPPSRRGRPRAAASSPDPR